MSAARSIATFIVLAVALTVPAAAEAAHPGQLDPAFAGGVVSTPGVQLYGAAARAGGSVVASGTDGGARVLQYTAAGSPVASAGAPGVVARGVAIDSGGNAVVAGGSAASGTGMVVERFSGAGLDPSFGSRGVVSLLAGSRGVANAVAIDPSGKIVVAGSVLPSGGDGTTRVAVARLNSNGSLDGSFGSGGVVILDFSSYSAANGVVVQPDGKVVLVGSQRPGFQVTNGFVARLNSNGSLDAGFGGAGNPNVACSPGVCFYWHPVGGAYSSLNAVTLQSDGKIVAAGVDLRSQNDPGQPTCTTGDCPQAIVLRLTPGGAPDPTFGAGGLDGNGVAALPSGSQTNTGDPSGAYGVGIGGGGAIIATGDYQQQIGGEVALWAFTASGSPDTAFGSGGTVITPLGGDAHGRALVVGSDGSLLVAGQAGAGGFLARYVGLGPPLAGGAPAVVTGAPTAVTASAATVGGQVNPNGLATAFHVEYGLSATYGATSAGGNAGAGTAPVGVSVTLTGLQPGTTYHYRFVGANAAGTVAGADRTFTTASQPRGAPGVATGTARASDVSATVSGQVNPDGLPSQYQVEYGRTRAYGSSTTAVALPVGFSPVGVTARLLRLRPNTTYHYRFVASNADGTTYGSDRTFTTARSLIAVLHGVARSYRVSAVIKNGVMLSVGCNQRCSIAASMLVSKSAAKQLGLSGRQTTIGGGSASLKRSGTAHLRLRVKLGRAGLRKLAAERALAVTLRVVTTPAGGGLRVTSSSTVTFGR